MTDNIDNQEAVEMLNFIAAKYKQIDQAQLFLLAEMQVQQRGDIQQDMAEFLKVIDFCRDEHGIGLEIIKKYIQQKNSKSNNAPQDEASDFDNSDDAQVSQGQSQQPSIQNSPIQKVVEHTVNPPIQQRMVQQIDSDDSDDQYEFIEKLQQEQTSLRKIIEDHQNKIQQQQKELNDLKAQNRQLMHSKTKNNAQLQPQLPQIQADTVQYQQKLQIQKDKLFEMQQIMEKRSQDFNLQLNVLKRELNDERTAVKTLKLDIRNLNTELEMLTQQGADFTKQNDIIMKHKDQTIQQLQQYLTQQKERFDEEKNIYQSEMLKDKENLIDRLASISKQFQTTNEDLNNMREVFEKQQQELLNQKKTAINLSKNHKKHLEQVKEQYQDKIDALTLQLNEIKCTDGTGSYNHNQSNEEQELRQTVKQLYQKLDDKNNTIEEMMEWRNEILKELELKNQQIAFFDSKQQIVKQANDFDRREHELKCIIQNQKEEIQLLKKSIKPNKELIDQLNNEKQQLIKNNQELKEELQEVINELNNQGEQHTVPVNQNQIDFLKLQLDEAKCINIQYERQLGFFKKQLNAKHEAVIKTTQSPPKNNEMRRSLAKMNEFRTKSVMSSLGKLK
ncbi:Hypothetical_protein [Hexamita inflata]|uniref:Hypothetical_protein n=1 Tax=Hexamita inflata TaxID=28002 RepID=A0ABP1GF72_9EUKA